MQVRVPRRAFTETAPGTDSLLFQTRDLQDWLQDRLRAARTAATTFPREELLRDGVIATLASLIDQYGAEPLVIDWGASYSTGAQEDWVNGVPLSRYDFRSPVVSGSLELPTCRPSSYSLTPPSGLIDHSQHELVVFVLASGSASGEQIEAAWLQIRQRINHYVAWIAADIAAWHSATEAELKASLERRYAALTRSGAVESAMTVPIRPVGAKEIPVPVKRTRVNPGAATSPRPFAQEAVLESEIYEQVIDTLALVCRGFERLPETFARLHDEERVRDVLLVVLNANYEGQAGAELFNFYGKTDLLIKWGDRNVFIRECKFWTGQSGLKDALDQLSVTTPGATAKLHCCCLSTARTPLRHRDGSPSHQRTFLVHFGSPAPGPVTTN
jgi:hypothetical protein